MDRTIIANIITIIFQAIYLLVIARAVLSWFPKARGVWVDFIIKVTDPMLAPIRHFVPLVGRVDFSPLILLFILQIIREIILLAI
jgi:YggT family protein